MGTCISTSCKRGNRGRVPHSKDTATPKVTSPYCPPSPLPHKTKDEIQCDLPPQKPLVSAEAESSDSSTQDKRVVVHETVRDAPSAPARPPVRSLKENKNVNLSSRPLKPAGAFSGKPTDRQIPVKRRAPESSPTRPRPCRTASVPARVIERETSRRSDSVEPRPRTVPVKRQNFGELRSGSTSFRAQKGCTSNAMKGGDYLKRTNSSRRTSEIKGKGLVCAEPEKLVEQVTEKSTNVCGEPAENVSVSEDEFDSNLPPIDLENPVISLDCFIFLL